MKVISHSSLPMRLILHATRNRCGVHGLTTIGYCTGFFVRYHRIVSSKVHRWDIEHQRPSYMNLVVAWFISAYSSLQELCQDVGVLYVNGRICEDKGERQACGLTRIHCRPPLGAKPRNYRRILPYIIAISS